MTTPDGSDLIPIMHAAAAPTPEAASLAVADLLSHCHRTDERTQLLVAVDKERRTAAMHAVLAGNVSAGVIGQLIGEGKPGCDVIALHMCITQSGPDGNSLVHALAAEGSQASIDAVLSLFAVLDDGAEQVSVMMQNNRLGESPLLVAVKVRSAISTSDPHSLQLIQC